MNRLPLDSDNLPAWRSWLLDRVIAITFIACLGPVGLVTLEAGRSGLWGHAILCWSSLGLLAVLSRPQLASHTVRAACCGLLLYLFGLWLLTRGAAAGMLYLLAFPVLLAMVLDTRTAMLALAGACLSLAGAGWLLELPIPMLIGLPDDSVLRWVTIAGNLLWLGVLMTLATGFLLRRLERALDSQRYSAALLREVASQVPGMVFRLSMEPGQRPRFSYVSPGSQQVLGLAPEALLEDAGALSARLDRDDLRALRDQLSTAVHAGLDHCEAEVRVRQPDGSLRWVQVQASEVKRQGNMAVLTGVATDITERKQAEEMVQRQVYTDMLTGLPNRLSLQIELTRALSDAQRHQRKVGLLLVDLDRFKEVNDTRGHAGGDALLVQAGQRLQDSIGPKGIVARVGGDEFVLLVTGADCEEAAARLGQQVLEDMSRAFMVQGQQAFVSASVGITIHPDDGDDAGELLTRADQALYEAKGAGRNQCIRFTSELQERAQRRVRLANDLRSVIDSGQLSLVYQPIIELGSRRVAKAEALLRWQHPELGAVSPAEFIPIAESAGLIDGIGSWVLTTAAQQARVWRQTLDPAFRISINHSPLQFRSEQGRAEPWSQHLQRLGIPGEALIIEITEGLLLDHSDRLADRLRELRATGVQIALDDFGTGYSALAYLHRYEIDLLKIDRSFVSGTASGQTGRSLCRAMVALAQELDVQVVAEGVETAEQSDWLKSICCEHAQGWLYARGMPAPEFERWYRHHLAAVAEPA